MILQSVHYVYGWMDRPLICSLLYDLLLFSVLPLTLTDPCFMDTHLRICP